MDSVVYQNILLALLIGSFLLFALFVLCASAFSDLNLCCQDHPYLHRRGEADQIMTGCTMLEKYRWASGNKLVCGLCSQKSALLSSLQNNSDCRLTISENGQMPVPVQNSLNKADSFELQDRKMLAFHITVETGNVHNNFYLKIRLICFFTYLLIYLRKGYV
ncbi:unnamed protein product [Dracunculus medinensis]|uniref:Protein FAM189A1 n=1 Tax=Dracunculus medinensis TaxID=318479 RepID=A0A0N4UQY6_DRAME|nr:unnamed protein product [Dracunculus medinensis]